MARSTSSRVTSLTLSRVTVIVILVCTSFPRRFGDTFKCSSAVPNFRVNARYAPVKNIFGEHFGSSPVPISAPGPEIPTLDSIAKIDNATNIRTNTKVNITKLGFAPTRKSWLLIPRRKPGLWQRRDSLGEFTRYKTIKYGNP